MPNAFGVPQKYSKTEWFYTGERTEKTGESNKHEIRDALESTFLLLLLLQFLFIAFHFLPPVSPVSISGFAVSGKATRPFFRMALCYKCDAGEMVTIVI